MRLNKKYINVLKCKITKLNKNYGFAEIDEVLGGALGSESPKLIAVADAKMVDELPCADALMNMMAERLPEVVSATK